MTTTPYQFIKQGQLFIIPVGPSISEVDYPVQSYTKPAEHSLWVRGRIEEPSSFRLDRRPMAPAVYQEVRDDIARFAPVEVSRVALRRSEHAYVGVIDSKGTPYYFALDGRGISVREADANDERVWKTFARLSEEEHMQGVKQRRGQAATEMIKVEHELSEPRLVVTKGIFGAIREGLRRQGQIVEARIARKQPKQPRQSQPKAPKAPKPTPEQRDQAHVDRYEARMRGRQAVRDKLRAERKQAQAAGKAPPGAPQPKADDTKLKQWKQKYPQGAVADRHANPFEKGVPLIVTKGFHEDEGRRQAGARYVAEYRKVGAELAEQCGEEDLDPPQPEDRVHLTVLKGGKGELTFPKDHVAAMQVPKGGSSCANCKFVDKKGHACKSENYAKWAGTHKLPKLPLDEICSDWYEPAVKLEKGRKKKRHVERTGPDAWRFKKALPKKAKEEKTSQKKPSKAASKKAGAGGKTRYSYPNEKGGGAAAKPKAQPLVVVHDDSKNANPQELANQLGVSVRTLQRTAKRLGRESFGKFMRSHLKRFAAKHRLDTDYWSTLYERLAEVDRQGTVAA